MADVAPEHEGAELSQRAMSMVANDEQATLTWRELTVTVSTKGGSTRKILSEVAGYAEPRQLVALMGPSGSGKSTLLDSLAGRLAKNATRNGEILLNGIAQPLLFGVAAYVSQDDVLIGTLTVRETLHFAARLRLPPSMPSTDKLKVVDDLISEMGLDDVANTYVGNWHLRGVSGGQKRRVSIALELITRPALLFLDEPTSGLDSAASYYVMGTIKHLASAGRTVIASIHQPSGEVFNLFDTLCLLSGGRMMYFGAVKDAAGLFNSAGFPCPEMRNPPDHFLRAINSDFDFVKKKGFMSDLEEGQAEPLDEVDTGEVVERLLGTYEKSESHTETVQKVEELSSIKGALLSGLSPAPLTRQMVVLTHRSFLNMLRNLGLFWLRMGMYSMLMICIGTIFYNIGYSFGSIQDRAAVLFFIVAFLTFMAVAGFPAFIEDMKVFQRERANGHYAVISFVISNTLSSLPFVFLISLVSSLIVYWLIKLNDSGDAVICFIMLLFASLAVVEGLMMAIASVVPNFLMGIAGGAGIMGMYMLVCGFFKLPSALPDPVWRYPFHYISFHTYAFQGFMQNEFYGLTFSGPEPGTTITGTQALALYDIPADLGTAITKWVDFAILMGWMVFYRMVFYSLITLKEIMQNRRSA